MAIELKRMVTVDMEGDACMLVQIIDAESGDHIRYATTRELLRLLGDDQDPLPVPEGVGICLTCGGECSDEGRCENACTECGDHYADGGDGYDGLCPSCADAAEPDTCENCGCEGVRLGADRRCENGCGPFASEEAYL